MVEVKVIARIVTRILISMLLNEMWSDMAMLY